jgi:aspartate/methionine/tyrosine aminotransferase
LLLCDEVYRGIDQDDRSTTASVTDLYERGISTGSMSKAFSLAELRLGWAVGPTRLVHDLSIHRDYTTISVGMVDDLLAAHALEHADAVLARNHGITRTNLATLAAWVDADPHITLNRPGFSGGWVVPRAGARGWCSGDPHSSCVRRGCPGSRWSRTPLGSGSPTPSAAGGC